ncbi:MAG: hypothetical protein J5780_06045 [Treponema sp.]|nr:hypothetical protein [Treponema sp.]
MRKIFAAFIFITAAAIAGAEKVNFFLEPAYGNEKLKVSLNWDEKWLSESSFEYNHDLARIACVLSESSYADVLESPDDNQMLKNYLAMGIKKSDVEFHYDIDYNAPILRNNQAACSFASKKSGDSTLVFVTIRGTPSEAHEWVSNINISDTYRTADEIHEGFFYTSTEIHRALIYYLLIKKIDPENCRFLITGHSRGGSVANLLAETLCDEDYFQKGGIYVYTFAAPNVSTTDKVSDDQYKFIWNIVNPEDLIPTVPPCRGGWQFKKFGNTLSFVSSWTCADDFYEKKFLPGVNEVFRKFFDRDYCPFKTGTFIPSVFTRGLTDFYSTVGGYYSSRVNISKKIENVFFNMFPSASRNSVDEVSTEENSSKIMQFLGEMLNKRTNGLLDYSALAFSDMHSCKTYLSFMLAFDKDELFTDKGCSQLVIRGNCECAVFDKNGKVLVRMLDGMLQFSSITLPIGAMYVPGITVIGFPSNADFTVAIYKDSIFPTYVPVVLEQYDSAGYFTGEEISKNFFPHKGIVYKIKGGKIFTEKKTIDSMKVRFKEARYVVKTGDLKPDDVFRIQPEINFNSDFNFGFGVRLGSRNIYGSLLAGHSITDLGESIDLFTGVGHQTTLYGWLLFDTELYAKTSIAVEEPDTGSRFNIVPETRLSLVYRPFHRFQFFTGCILDFHINGFNDGAFDSSSRTKTLGSIEVNDRFSIVPSISIGMRF